MSHRNAINIKNLLSHSTRCENSLADWQEATDPVVSPKLGASYLASDRVMLLASLARWLPRTRRRHRRSGAARS